MKKHQREQCDSPYGHGCSNCIRPALPEHLSMSDPMAETLWQIARKVNEHRRLAGKSARDLAVLEFEEWDWVTREIAGYELTNEAESAVAAIVVAMRAAR